METKFSFHHSQISFYNLHVQRLNLKVLKLKYTCSIMNIIIAVFQIKHLILKTPGLELFKMWSTIFVTSKLTEILRNLYKFQFIY